MFVCLSPGGQSITSGESQKDKLFVGTVDGIFSFQKSGGCLGAASDHGAGEAFQLDYFRADDPRRFSAALTAVKFTPARILARTWERRDNGIGEKEIYSLATQVVNGKPRIYAGTQPAHLFYSDDLGKSWTELPGCVKCQAWRNGLSPASRIWRTPRASPFIRRIRTSFTSPSKSAAFLRSTDGGKTWTTVDNINPDAHRVLVPTNDPSKLYGTAPTTNCGPETAAGFCVSSDGGASWTSMTPRDFRIGYVDPFFVHPKDPNLLFVAGAKTGPAPGASSTPPTRASRAAATAARLGIC